MSRKVFTSPRRRVLVFGAFDIFHPGHRSFFRQAKKLGNELVVAVGRDRVVARLKRRRVQNPERHRLARVAGEPTVDQAVLAPKDPRQRFRFIKKLRPHIIALGYDQTHYTADLDSGLKKHGIPAAIVRLRAYRPRLYKGAILRKKRP